ncbi:hypothetical protein ACX0G7_09760 [Flavitalea antarctica]
MMNVYIDPSSGVTFRLYVTRQYLPSILEDLFLRFLTSSAGSMCLALNDIDMNRVTGSKVRMAAFPSLGANPFYRFDFRNPKINHFSIPQSKHTVYS